ncbi:MAG: A/G-specific adenine glycosylase [Deltaproteobacteria bacterium]|nr:A/G-specific adenine glycosylase [Deltaproteobacteria bacterium]
MAALRAAVPALHAWYRATARDLPWRRSRDPYAIWVSEAMLQQTRVATVLPYYARWMEAFPTVETLAKAPERRVLKLWEGLGYYSRARNFHLASRDVVVRFGGRVPADPASFESLPGVGGYTAAAVLSIAFGANLPVVDGNVIRVLSRLTALSADPRRAPASAALAALAGELLPPGTGALHNQAVMELGALVCTPRAPRCAECPLAAVCRAGREGRPERYPPRRAKPAVPHHDVALGIVFDRDRVLIDQRPYGGLLGGLWEFPGGKVEPGESPARAVVRELREELGLEVAVGEPLTPVKHAYSHLRVTLHPFLCRLVAMDARTGEGRPHRWISPEELPDYPMPRANRKVIEELARTRKDLR